MKRRNLVRHFTGSPTSTVSEPDAPDEGRYDRVDLKIHTGQVSFIVPSDVSDEGVYQSQWLDRFIGCELDLGDGYVLHLTVSGDCLGVDARIERK
jgi:hypothetical protein